MRTRHCCGYLGDPLFTYCTNFKINFFVAPTHFIDSILFRKNVAKKKVKRKKAFSVRNMGIISSENEKARKLKNGNISTNFHFYKKKLFLKSELTSIFLSWGDRILSFLLIFLPFFLRLLLLLSDGKMKTWLRKEKENAGPSFQAM